MRCVWLFVAPWTVAHDASLSMEFPQARILERVAISYSRMSSWPSDWNWVSCISCRQEKFFTCWAIREADTQIYIYIIFSELGFLQILSPRKYKPNSLLVVKVACWIAYEIYAMTREKTSSNSNKSVYQSALFQNAKIIKKINKSKSNGNSSHSFTILKIWGKKIWGKKYVKNVFYSEVAWSNIFQADTCNENEGNSMLTKHAEIIF